MGNVISHLAFRGSEIFLGLGTATVCVWRGCRGLPSTRVAFGALRSSPASRFARSFPAKPAGRPSAEHNGFLLVFTKIKLVVGLVDMCQLTRVIFISDPV